MKMYNIEIFENDLSDVTILQEGYSYPEEQSMIVISKEQIPALVSWLGKIYQEPSADDDSHQQGNS